MRALVTHHYWDRPGGGEIVASAFAKAFKDLGFHTEITATTRFCVPCYKDWFGIDITDIPIHSMPFRMRAFGIYLRNISWIPPMWVIPRLKPDIVFIDFYAVKPIVKLKKMYDFKTIEYIHYPFEVVYKSLKYHWRKDPYISERYGVFPWNLYLMGALWLGELFNRGNPFEVNEVVMANSKWTANVVRDVYGEEPIVLNPPIPPNVSIVRKPRPFEDRQLAVIMIGRFAREKRYHWVVGELMPRLAKEVPGVKLVIVGGTGTKPSNAYYERIRRLAIENKLNVELYPNAPGDVKVALMDQARVFLHATINEHWGVVVAEAMARGLPVVVHRSGGAWSDLAMGGEVGLGYESVDEAVNALARLLTDAKVWGHYSSKSLGRVGEITFDKFVSRLSELVRKLV
jgi:glycosyltransferase involved in cell wall biosynthesis